MFEFFKDILSSFRQNSLDRIKSPFMGAFVFSWFGFNWQMVAILLFQKDKMIERIDYINKHFDISSYLLGPICTTALICLLMPYINNLVMKYQEKPNTNASRTTMQSKIRISRLQLIVANNDAKKKLAEKRQELFIANEIDSIKKSSDGLRKLLNESESRHKDSREQLQKLSSSNESMAAFIEAKEKESENQKSKISLLTIQADDLKKANHDLALENSKKESQINNLNNRFGESISEQKNLNAEISRLRSENENYLRQMSNLIDQSVSKDEVIASIKKEIDAMNFQLNSGNRHILATPKNNTRIP